MLTTGLSAAFLTTEPPEFASLGAARVQIAAALLCEGASPPSVYWSEPHPMTTRVRDGQGGGGTSFPLVRTSRRSSVGEGSC